MPHELATKLLYKFSELNRNLRFTAKTKSFNS